VIDGGWYIQDLKAYLDLGFYIAITGFLCNDARGVELREVVKLIPLEKLVCVPPLARPRGQCPMCLRSTLPPPLLSPRFVRAADRQ
jgi:hypothetical protein